MLPSPLPSPQAIPKTNDVEYCSILFMALVAAQ